MVEHAKSDFGTRMRHHREGRGISLRQIADATKISTGVLEALERSDLSRLPGGIFSRAFVRSYAIEIGLDPEPTVRDFMGQFPDDSVTAGRPHAPKPPYDVDQPPRHTERMAVVAVVALSVVIGVNLFFTLTAQP